MPAALQIHAYAEDTANMTTAAAALSPRYGSLFPPTVIMAGDADKIVSYRQAQRLHGEVAGSHLDIWPGASHMIHHLDPGRFVAASMNKSDALAFCRIINQKELRHGSKHAQLL